MAPLLTRKPICLVVPVAAIHPDDHSLLCERIRVKDRVITCVRRRQGLLAMMLARKRGRSSSCVAGMLSRIVVTAAYSSGMQMVKFPSLSSDLPLVSVSSLPLSHLIYSDTYLLSFPHDIFPSYTFFPHIALSLLHIFLVHPSFTLSWTHDPRSHVHRTVQELYNR